MVLKRIDFPASTISAQLSSQLQPILQQIAQLQALLAMANTQQASREAQQLKAVLGQVDVTLLNDAQRIFYQEQAVEMGLEADHIVRIQEVEHQRLHLATLVKKASLLSFAFKLGK